MTAYPDKVFTEYHNGTNWVDLSSYVVSDIRGKSGFISARPSDRLAGLGTLQFDLNNAGGYFTPYGGDALRGLSTMTGFNKGAKVRVRVVVANRSHTIWVGRIADIKSDDGTWGNQRVHLMCVDWMDVATRFPMKGSTILTNKTIDQAVTSLLARLSIQPDGTSFDVGTEVFPAVFSDVKDKTKAIGELNKLALSELGYIYVMKDGTLRIENSAARKGTRTRDVVNRHPSTMDNLLLADGDDFELVDGDTLLLEAREVAQLDYTAEELTIETNDDQTLNSASVAAYPVRVDTSLVVIFSLGQPLALSGGTPLKFTGRYTNPNGGSPISGTNQQAPVATTDYLFNTSADGTGSNITANLSVSATYYGDQVEYTLTSSYAGVGYVTKLQARGFGIYFDSPVQSDVSDETSIAANGDYSITLDQRYKTNLYSGTAYAKSVVELMKDPKSRVVKARFLANLSEPQMMSCISLDVGSLASIHDNRSEMTKWYYIFSRAFVITLGGIMTFTFGAVEAPSLDSGGLNPVAVEFRGNPTKDAVVYPYMPHLANLKRRSYSLWLYAEAPGALDTGAYYLLSAQSSGKGYSIYFGHTSLRVGFVQGGVSDAGFWDTPGGTAALNTWLHVLVTRDTSVASNPPVIYINAVPQTIIVSSPLTSSLASEEGLPLVIGNLKTPSVDYGNTFKGKLSDVRIYDRILTQAEATAIYNSGVRDMAAGPQDMVFQAFAINSDLGDATSLNGQQIPVGHNYFENIFRHVGTPHGAPIIR